MQVSVVSLFIIKSHPSSKLTMLHDGRHSLSYQLGVTPELLSMLSVFVSVFFFLYLRRLHAKLFVISRERNRDSSELQYGSDPDREVSYRLIASMLLLHFSKLEYPQIYLTSKPPLKVLSKLRIPVLLDGPIAQRNADSLIATSHAHHFRFARCLPRDRRKRVGRSE